VIGSDATLVECVVCDGARIPDGARYERCAIVPATGTHPGREGTIGERTEDNLLITPIP
jgi:hypothetical protein